MDEKMITGYCRCLDCSRIVTVEIESDGEASVDCTYFECPHRYQCSIAAEITAFLEK